MPDITINGISKGLVDKINSLAEQSKYSNRSAFLIAALNDYCLYHDRYFMHSLPDSIRILSEDVIEKPINKERDMLGCALETIAACNSLMKQLIDFLSGDNEDLEDENEELGDELIDGLPPFAD